MTSPFADLATVTLACATWTPVFYNSLSAVMAISNVLVSVVATEMEYKLPDFQKRVEALQERYDNGYETRKSKTVRVLHTRR